jgi:hypothetical protein
MTPDKQRRVANATGFVSGVLACLDALRDARAVWPPEAAWAALRNPKRLEMAAGIVLIAVTLVVSLVRPRDT